MKSKEEILKSNIPNGIVNIHAIGKGNGKPQKQAEDDIIIKCMDIHAEIMMNAILSWYAPTMTPDEVQKVVTGFLSSDYLKELQK